MSLKAKIEAVIYASEEPVTLLQLAGLLGGEAQAELDAEDARQGELALRDLGPVPVAAVGEDPAEQEAHQDPSETSEPALANFEPATPLPEPEALGSPEPTSAELKARERRLRDYLRAVLDRLIADYRAGDHGLEIREIAGGYRFATKPEYHDAVRGFVRSLKPPFKLSLQALETLAVVAYKQPVTAPEVSEIRGVDSGGVLGSLLTRKLVAAAGRKQVIGRPILYKTTKEFLLRFGLRDVNELPSIEEFERLALDMNGALQEEIPMDQETVVPTPASLETPPLSPEQVRRDVEPSRDTHLSQADGDPNPSPLSDDEVSAEHLTPAADGPGEFTGNESAPPADNAAIDGRLSGLPPVYDTPSDEVADSPANDAAVQAADTDPSDN